MNFKSEENVFRHFVRMSGGKVRVSRRGWVRDGDRDREALSEVGTWDGWLSGTSSVPDGVPVRLDENEKTLLLPVDADIRAGDYAVYSQSGQPDSQPFYITGAPVRFPTHIEVKVRKKAIV